MAEASVITRRGLVQAGAAVLGAVSLPSAPSALASSLPASASPDAALTTLLAWHATATAEWNELGQISDTLYERFLEACPEMPAALIAPYEEDLGVRTVRTEGVGWIYGEFQIEQLRAIEVPTRRGWIGTHEQWLADDKTGWEDVPCPKKIARRLEVLAAYDAWKAESDAVSERTGYSAADAKACAACDVVGNVEVEILAHKPSTLAGFIAKAQWVVAQHSTDDWAETIVRDLCSLAEAA